MKTFKEIIQESVNKSQGLERIKEFIKAYKGKSEKDLKKKLSEFGNSDLMNIASIAKNVFKFKTKIEDTEDNKKFLNTLNKLAVSMITKEEPPKPKVTENTWKKFESLLKKHDWNFDRSDDSRVFNKGYAEKRSIDALYSTLKDVDKKKADKLIKKYRGK